VELMRRLDRLGDLLAARPLRRRLRQWRGRGTWPPLPGAYLVGDPTAPVAVCTLTGHDLMHAVAALPHVAITGRVATANLGIEKIIVNVTANPNIRFLLLCGPDSPLFHPGQTLTALAAGGVTTDRRVIGATGYLPALRGVTTQRIEHFRSQVELVDHIGETDPTTIGRYAAALATRDPGPYAPSHPPATPGQHDPQGFTMLKPGGGKRRPIGYDPAGYFVITLDQTTREIVVSHYLTDNTPAHQMRGHSAEPILAGLLRQNLISQLDHAGYLGAELTKAETALRLGLRYDQDRPLRAIPA
jgi:tetrahydromethanopterin S-methyltransferase subunit A